MKRYDQRIELYFFKKGKNRSVVVNGYRDLWKFIGTPWGNDFYAIYPDYHEYGYN